jgi:transposase InsO family protein
MLVHPIYRYLLRDLKIGRPNQIWATDITYIPMRRGFVYLIAVIDWYSRKDLSWRLSSTMTTDFCLDAVRDAISRYGKPEIFNTDQGSQFTSHEFTQLLKDNEIQIGRDGKGCWRDNVFVERLWKSVKYEEVYLKAYDSVSIAKIKLGAHLNFFTPAGRISRLTAIRRIRSTTPVCRKRGAQHNVRVTHRDARLPLDGVASGHKSAGGGPVDNPTPQGSTCHRRFFVQLNGASFPFSRTLRNEAAWRRSCQTFLNVRFPAWRTSL